MFNWLFNKHKHTYSEWNTIKTLVSESTGLIKIVQCRICTTCGYAQIDTQGK